MSEVKSYKIKRITTGEARPFVKKWHYSGILPASTDIFGLYKGEIIIGVAAYGHPAMRNQASCYNVDIELRRLCLIDDTPKNAESRFISLTMKELKKMFIHLIWDLIPY